MFTKIYSNYIISQSQLQQFHSLICNPFLRTYSKIVHLYTKGGQVLITNTHTLSQKGSRQGNPEGSLCHPYTIVRCVHCICTVKLQASDEVITEGANILTSMKQTWYWNNRSKETSTCTLAFK